ncbi:condensation domain-containing protein [Streptomyces tricolor]|nr:condensation domain-containing protein [Streptomyces tricolor]
MRALLLSRYGGGDDVVFGTTVSGRPAELPGVTSMMGLFINTRPTRVRVDGSASCRTGCGSRQAAQSGPAPRLRLAGPGAVVERRTGRHRPVRLRSWSSRTTRSDAGALARHGLAME